jgi:5-methylcytosine-specific restriction endonuclease McrA
VIEYLGPNEMVENGNGRLAGQRFGRLTVLGDSHKRDKRGVILWQCRCDCGKTTLVRTFCLTTGQTKSCGCLRGEWAYRDLTGNRYGRLLVVADSGKRQKGHVLWSCLCDCGETVLVLTRSLTARRTNSCGCLQAEAAARQFRILAQQQRGQNHPRWMGGQTGRYDADYLDWRNAVYERDGFRCVICGTNRGIAAHHIDSFADNRGKALCAENGVILCKKHHRQFHRKYGFGNNNASQWTEFQENHSA